MDYVSLLDILKTKSIQKMKFSIYKLIALIALVIYIVLKIYDYNHSTYYNYLLGVSILFIIIDAFNIKKNGKAKKLDL